MIGRSQPHQTQRIVFLRKHNDYDNADDRDSVYADDDDDDDDADADGERLMMSDD